MVEELYFEDFPTRHLTVLLFKNVTNASEIRGMVMTGALQPECAIINGALVPDLAAVHAAAFKALQAQARGQLRTKSLHAEVVFGLSGSRHIAESLTRFGVNEDCQHLLVARFDASPGDLERIRGAVAGAPAPLAELPGLADSQVLQKYYKVAAPELAVGSLGAAVQMRIAARDC
eukprot:scaffold10.g2245.t1